jgi:hypothetical protein
VKGMTAITAELKQAIVVSPKLLGQLETFGMTIEPDTYSQLYSLFRTWRTKKFPKMEPDELEKTLGQIYNGKIGGAMTERSILRKLPYYQNDALDFYGTFYSKG